MFRILIGIVLGAAVAFACVELVEMLGGRLYPIAPGVDQQTWTNAAQAMAAMPLSAKLLAVAGWCIGTVLGGLVAVVIGHREIGAWVVAGLVVAGALTTTAMVPHPGWMVACAVLLPWGCAYLVKRGAHWRRAH